MKTFSVRGEQSPSAPARAMRQCLHLTAGLRATRLRVVLASCDQRATPATTTAAPDPKPAHSPLAYGIIPPPPADKRVTWGERVWGQPLELQRQIFCNRSLNMKAIRAVGFDMDYTLAQYKPESFEGLAHVQTIEKLISSFGYPSELRDLSFDYRYMMRGLVIDKKRGNTLKVDRHKYVKIAYHGFRKLTRDERNSVYNYSGVRDSFEEPDYAMVDTLFSLAEGYLYMQLVEMLDAAPQRLPPGAGYASVYRDVRAAVDLCHRDGSLKREVAAHPDKYIHADPQLVPMLQLYKRSGRQIFLATNSLWDYTNVVMNYLIEGRTGRDKTDEWLRLFDVVLVGCGKPGFFNERRPLFAVDPASGSLRNTDNGAPILPIGEEDLPREDLGSTASCLDLGSREDKALVFQGGNYTDLHKMLGIRSGSEVLYVGDHIFGDILRSKKSLGWRTMLVVPELETELAQRADTMATQGELKLLRAARADLDDRIQRLEWAFLQREVPDSSYSQNMEQLAALRVQRDQVKREQKELLRAHHEDFHPVWGQLLKTGYQNSRYAHQIDRFACLYTSHVTNMAYYSPDKIFAGRVDYMSHEDSLIGLGGELPAELGGAATGGGSNGSGGDGAGAGAAAPLA